MRFGHRGALGVAEPAQQFAALGVDDGQRVGQLAEHLALALLAAAAGLAVGWLAAPLLTNPGAGLVGTPGAPSLTLPTVELVTAVSLAVAVAATLVPAIRAARTSTVSALAAAARPVRRRAALIAASIAVTVTGLVTVLAFHGTTEQPRFGGSSGLSNPVADRDGRVLLVITVVLVVLAAVNAIFTAWATVLDARRPSAVARALGVTPERPWVMGWPDLASRPSKCAGLLSSSS